MIKEWMGLLMFWVGVLALAAFVGLAVGQVRTQPISTQGYFDLIAYVVGAFIFLFVGMAIYCTADPHPEPYDYHS